jgi:hypothetical protein
MIKLKSGKIITLNRATEDELLKKFMNFQGFKFSHEGREILHTEIEWINDYKVSDLLEETKGYERKMQKLKGMGDLRKTLSKQGII